MISTAVKIASPRFPIVRPLPKLALGAERISSGYADKLKESELLPDFLTDIYHKSSDQQTYERFETVRLVTDAKLLKRFVFLSGAARVVPDSGPFHFHELLRGSETVGR